MKNFADIMKKAQQMQQKMTDMQKELESAEVTGAAGAGMVQVVMTGDGKARKVSIDPSVTQDTEVLEDLLVVAINDARQKADELVAQKTDAMKSGLNLPFKLPF